MSPCWERESWLLCFSSVFGLSCCLFFLMVPLCSASVAIPEHLLYHFYEDLRNPYETDYTTLKYDYSWRNHACSNILKISPPKTERFQTKILILVFFIFLLKTWIVGTRQNRLADSDAYPQSKFLSRNKKNNVYPCKPQFYHIKVGFKGSKLYRYVFVMLSFRLTCSYLSSQTEWELKINCKTNAFCSFVQVNIQI